MEVIINAIIVQKQDYFLKVPVPEAILFLFVTYYCLSLFVTTLPECSVIENILNIKFTSTDAT